MVPAAAAVVCTQIKGAATSVPSLLVVSMGVEVFAAARPQEAGRCGLQAALGMEAWRLGEARGGGE
jgi:hypothetical protein